MEGFIVLSILEVGPGGVRSQVDKIVRFAHHRSPCPLLLLAPQNTKPIVSPKVGDFLDYTNGMLFNFKSLLTELSDSMLANF